MLSPLALATVDGSSKKPGCSSRTSRFYFCVSLWKRRLLLRFQVRDDILNILKVELCTPLLRHHAIREVRYSTSARMDDTLSDILLWRLSSIRRVLEAVIDDACVGSCPRGAGNTCLMAARTARRCVNLLPTISLATL